MAFCRRVNPVSDYLTAELIGYCEMDKVIIVCFGRDIQKFGLGLGVFIQGIAIHRQSIRD